MVETYRPLPPEALDEQQRRQRLPVLDLAGAYHAHHLGPAPGVHFHELVRLPPVYPLLQLVRQIQMDLLIGESWCGIDRGETRQHIGGHPDLLFELSLGTGGRSLTRIETTGRDLPDRSIGRMAELPNDVNPGIGTPRFIDERDDG